MAADYGLLGYFGKAGIADGTGKPPTGLLGAATQGAQTVSPLMQQYIDRLAASRNQFQPNPARPAWAPTAFHDAPEWNTTFDSRNYFPWWKGGVQGSAGQPQTNQTNPTMPSVPSGVTPGGGLGGGLGGTTGGTSGGTKPTTANVAAGTPFGASNPLNSTVNGITSPEYQVIPGGSWQNPGRQTNVTGGTNTTPFVGGAGYATNTAPLGSNNPVAVGNNSYGPMNTVSTAHGPTSSWLGTDHTSTWKPIAEYNELNPVLSQLFRLRPEGFEDIYAPYYDTTLGQVVTPEPTEQQQRQWLQNVMSSEYVKPYMGEAALWRNLTKPTADRFGLKIPQYVNDAWRFV